MNTPINKNLQNAAQNYSGKVSHPLNNAFIAGANWQRDQKPTWSEQDGNILTQIINESCCSYIENLKYSIAREAVEKFTDIFIEKACEWLKDNIYHYIYECGDKLGFSAAVKFIDDFKNYMKEE